MSYTHKDLLESLGVIEDTIGFRLSDAQRIILTTDGSLTRILEILTKEPVVIETIERRIEGCDKELACMLDIDEGEPVNYRVVVLKAKLSKKPLVLARSYIPISRLSKRIFRDLTQTDMPIGLIIAKHGLEVRREVVEIGLKGCGSEERRVFGSCEVLLMKRYNIIRRGRILMAIEELIPLDLFR